MDNQSEFLAGTVPTDASSVMSMKANITGGQMHLAFTAQAGVSYTIEYKNSLTDSIWLKLTDIAAPATAQAMDIVDTVATPRRFYHLVTPQQP